MAPLGGRRRDRSYALQHRGQFDHRECAADHGAVQGRCDRPRAQRQPHQRVGDPRGTRGAGVDLHLDDGFRSHRASAGAVARTTTRSSGWRRRCVGVEGAYSLVVMINQTLLAARDPRGWRPLVMGRLGDSVYSPPETCALDIVGRDAAARGAARRDHRGRATVRFGRVQAFEAHARSRVRLRARVLRTPGQPDLRRLVWTAPGAPLAVSWRASALHRRLTWSSPCPIRRTPRRLAMPRKAGYRSSSR